MTTRHTATVHLRSVTHDDFGARLYTSLVMHLAPRLVLAGDGAGIHALAADGRWYAALFARANGDACLAFSHADGSQSTAWAVTGVS